MDFSVWKTACRFCGRLAETDECRSAEITSRGRVITPVKSDAMKCRGSHGSW